MKSEQIILALDVDSAHEALVWAKRFRGKVGTFKVGLQLFLRAGQEVLTGLQQMEVPIFLDLKFHDIPETVGQAVRAVAQWKPLFLTLHASGGKEMMEAAISSAPKETRVLGVTLLTSLSDKAVRNCGWTGGVEATVEQLSDLARQSGLSGVVCSAHEAKKTRSCWGPTAEIITPGVRLPGAQADDQARCRSPFEAIADGASRIVVGRPILKSADPEAALETLLADAP